MSHAPSGKQRRTFSAQRCVQLVLSLYPQRPYVYDSTISAARLDFDHSMNRFILKTQENGNSDVSPIGSLLPSRGEYFSKKSSLKLQRHHFSWLLKPPTGYLGGAEMHRRVKTP